MLEQREAPVDSGCGTLSRYPSIPRLGSGQRGDYLAVLVLRESAHGFGADGPL
jgi:hypothetical protein